MMMTTQEKFVTFRIDDYLFGINILSVREITCYTHSTSVPLAAPHIEGLINLRGQIVTLLDLKQMLGLGKLEVKAETHTIILKTAQELYNGATEGNVDRVGVVIDAVGDIITVNTDELDPPPANIGDLDGQFLSCVVKLDEGVVSILNLDHILFTEEEFHEGKHKTAA